MADSSSDIFYKRHLPHYNPKDYAIFVTFRLANSLPNNIIIRLMKERDERLKEIASLKDNRKKQDEYQNMQREYFINYDSLLDKQINDIKWLNNCEIAKIVKEALHFRDGTEYDLISYVIMPNHVHIVFIPLCYAGKQKSQAYGTSEILKSLKWFTATECNKLLKRKGSFWQQESYDHVVRDEKELKRIISYILNNPVKAGLVENSADWQWAYLNCNKLTTLIQ